jgi:flagellar assembly protein FliH
MGTRVKRDKFNVEDYVFNEFVSTVSGMRDFEFSDLEKEAVTFSRESQKVPAEVIRQERASARKTNFLINPDVQKYRGITDQEDADYENRVNFEVQNRLSALKASSEEEGFQKGFEEGQKQAYEEAKQEFDKKIAEFASSVDEIRLVREEMYKQEMTEAYKLIKSLAKWVALKEIDEDNTYLTRLLEKLILELNEKKNLLIRISAKNFDKMDGILDEIQNKLGALSNVRVEIDHDMQDDGGIILESEKGIIDGSYQAQFEMFSRVFETVGISDDGTES